jgi:hypothetical protein
MAQQGTAQVGISVVLVVTPVDIENNQSAKLVVLATRDIYRMSSTNGGVQVGAERVDRLLWTATSSASSCRAPWQSSGGDPLQVRGQ